MEKKEGEKYWKVIRNPNIMDKKLSESREIVAILLAVLKHELLLSKSVLVS